MKCGIDSCAIVLVVKDLNIKHTRAIVSSINSNWNFAEHASDNFDSSLMSLYIALITQVSVHCFSLFSRVKSTQDETVSFIKGNELKLTQVELLSFLFFKRVCVF